MAKANYLYKILQTAANVFAFLLQQTQVPSLPDGSDRKSVVRQLRRVTDRRESDLNSRALQRNAQLKTTLVTVVTVTLLCAYCGSYCSTHSLTGCDLST